MYKYKKITPMCNFECEMIIGNGASLEDEEIIKIHDESIGMSIGNKYKSISISEFRNAAGQSIGEYMLDKHGDFAFDLMQKKVNLI